MSRSYLRGQKLIHSLYKTCLQTIKAVSYSYIVIALSSYSPHMTVTEYHILHDFSPIGLWLKFIFKLGKRYPHCSQNTHIHTHKTTYKSTVHTHKES